METIQSKKGLIIPTGRRKASGEVPHLLPVLVLLPLTLLSLLFFEYYYYYNHSFLLMPSSHSFCMMSLFNLVNIAQVFIRLETVLPHQPLTV